MKIFLTKSKYMESMQCPRKAWLALNHPELLAVDELTSSKEKEGDEVGDLARSYLNKPFVEVPFGKVSNMTKATQKLIDDGTKVITEASFMKDDIFCSCDILHVINKGKKIVDVYEVKASTTCKNYYIEDLKFQVYLLNLCGYTVRKSNILYVNSDYVFVDKLDIQDFFICQDVYFSADELIEVGKNIDLFQNELSSEKELPNQIGCHCEDPHTCPFFKHCLEDEPENTVFDLSGVTFKKKVAMYEFGLKTKQNILDFNYELNKKAPRLTDRAAIQLKETDKVINIGPVYTFMESFQYPLYFLDFETIQPAVPMWNGCRPYQQIPFQYSLHVIREKGAAIEHYEFLGIPGTDPRKSLAKALNRDLETEGTIIAYNDGFEKSVIKYLSSLYPKLQERLLSFIPRFMDLMVPFSSRWIYFKAFSGSYSIKKVLPTLFPNCAELDYHNLDTIQNGTAAMTTYKDILNYPIEEQEHIKHCLLKYCELDTFAMVKIFNWLMDLIAA